MRKNEGEGSYVTDLRGVSRLLIEATTGLTDVVEGMHHTIQRVPGILSEPPTGRTRGVTGLVYGTIRAVTGVVGASLDFALGQLAPILQEAPDAPERVHALGALNGVLGDHLERTHNPLALPMKLCVDGRGLTLSDEGLREGLTAPTGKIVVLVHGLCMNDLLWRGEHHEHGRALAGDLGFTPVYTRYNTGRHISTNGRQLADMLDQLVRHWPVPVEEICLVGHSMGGLVARSALHYAQGGQRAFYPHVRHLICLGSPHHGAVLERGGAWMHLLGHISPYTAPLARIPNIRSAGITDLRFGSLIDSDWLGTDRFAGRVDRRTHVPLPEDIACHAVAGTLNAKGTADATDPIGDGLVTVASALGKHLDAERRLLFTEANQQLLPGVGHVELMRSTAVYEAMLAWLQ